MIFVSAGHNSKSKTIRQDPGAVNSKGIKEGDLTIEFRDLVRHELELLGVPSISDFEEENLVTYLNRIKTAEGSVVVEYHFDAATNTTADGTSALIEAEADRLDKAFAKELSDITSAILKIRNRGVISEMDSHRGRLGLMREEGIISLIEICFITNEADLEKYHAKKAELAKVHAVILAKYDNMIK